MHTLFFTVREWNRFAWNMQEAICNKYDIILTDHQTTREKIISLLNKINIQNFNKGITLFNKSMNKFSKTIDSVTTNKSSFNGFDQAKNNKYIHSSDKHKPTTEIW